MVEELLAGRGIIVRHRQLVCPVQPEADDWQCLIGISLATHAADLGPDLKCLGSGSSVLGSSDVIAAEME